MGLNLKIFIVAALMSMFGVTLSKSARVIEHVPVQFITEQRIASKANYVNNFIVSLCGGCRYDTQRVDVFLALQKQKWSQETGSFLKATVLDPSENVIATNDVGNGQDNKWMSTFSFKYFSFYDNFKLRVINGPGSGIIYNITVKFDKINANCPNEQYSMSYIEARDQWKQKLAATGNGEGFYDLVPIFKTTEPSTVETGGIKYFQFTYCFPSATLSYSLSVAVYAADDKSAFATYACPKGIVDCDIQKAPFHDTVTSAANIVSVSISGQENIGPVTVIVHGDGGSEDINTFTIAASKYVEV